MPPGVGAHATASAMNIAPNDRLRPAVRAARRALARALRIGLVSACTVAIGRGGLAAQEPEIPATPTEHEVDVPVVEINEVPEPAPQDGRRARRLTRPRSAPAGDDELPSRLGGGFGYGRFHVNSRTLGGIDTDDAAVFRIDGDFWVSRHIGFGLTSELVSTGDELFSGQQVESGVGLRPADAQITSTDFAAYFAWDPVGSRRFRLPLQIGPWFSGTVFDFHRARIDYAFSTAGVRVGVRPEVKLIDSSKTDLVLFGGATYSIGYTSVYEDLVGPNETYDSDSRQFRAEGGLRVDLRRVSLGFHYVFSDMNIDRSSIENGRRVPEIDFTTNMFFFTIAGRF